MRGPSMKNQLLLFAILIQLFTAEAALALTTPLFSNDRAGFLENFTNTEIEDFESGDVADGAVTICSSTVQSISNDACFSPGEITNGIEFLASPSFGSMNLVGAGISSVPANTSKALTVGAAGDSLDIVFPGTVSNENVFMVGFDLMSTVTLDTCAVEVFREDGSLIGSTGVSCSDISLQFFGVASNEPIGRVRVSSLNAGAEVIDNVVFGSWNADISISLSSTAGDLVVPGETIVFTTTVTNTGPDTAIGAQAILTLPEQVTYISNNCGAEAPVGGVFSFIPNFGGLDASGAATCEITTTVNNSVRGNLVANASARAASPDSDTSNNNVILNLQAPDLITVLDSTFRKKRRRLVLDIITNDRATGLPFNFTERLPGVTCTYDIVTARGNTVRPVALSFNKIATVSTKDGQKRLNLRRMPRLQGKPRRSGQPTANLQAILSCEGLPEVQSNLETIGASPKNSTTLPYNRWISFLKNRIERVG